MKLFIHRLVPTSTKDCSLSATRSTEPVLIAAATLESAQKVAEHQIFLEMREYADSHEEAEQMVMEALQDRRSVLTELPCKAEWGQVLHDKVPYYVTIQVDSKTLFHSPLEMGRPS